MPRCFCACLLFLRGIDGAFEGGKDPGARLTYDTFLAWASVHSLKKLVYI